MILAYHLSLVSVLLLCLANPSSTRSLTFDNNLDTDESRNLQRDPPPLNICDYYDAFVHKFPGGRESCTCDGANTVINCSGENSCVGTVGTTQVQARQSTSSGIFNDQCVRSMDIDMTLYQPDMGSSRNRLVFSACSQYDDFREEICAEFLTTGLNMDTQKMSQCFNATYGGQVCNKCEVCNGGLGLDIDCTEYNADATTYGCQPIGINTDMRAMFPMIGIPNPEEDDTDDDEDVIVEERSASFDVAKTNFIAMIAASFIATLQIL